MKELDKLQRSQVVHRLKREKDSLLEASTQPSDSEVSSLYARAKLTQAVQGKFSGLAQVQL